MRIKVVRGAGESYRHNMCMDALAGLPNVDEVIYPAEIRPIGWHTLGESEAICRAALAVEDAKGESWIGIAYSLGATSLGDYVQFDHPRNCRGIIQVADPLRDPSQCSNCGVSPSSWGCAGRRIINTVPVHTFAIPDDPIASCPGDNGFRQIADMVTGLHQPVPAQWWNAGATLDQVMKYLVGSPNLDPGDTFHLSRHCAYAVESMPGTTQTYMQAVRAALTEIASA